MNPSGGVLERLLVRYTRWAATHPWQVLGGALALSLTCWALASQLRIQGDFVSLLPSESGTAKRFRSALQRKVSGASTLVVIIESPDAQANERFIDALAPRVASLPRALVASVQTGTKAERRFFEEQRWLFASERDLRLVRCELAHERDRQTFDLGLDEPCAVQVEDELRELGDSSGDSVLNATVPPTAQTAPAATLTSSSPLQQLRQRIEEAMAAQDRFKSDYFRNPTGTRYALVIRSSAAGMGELSSDELLRRVSALVAELSPPSFHPRAEVGFAGDIPNAAAERKSLIADIALVSALAIGLILTVIVGYFRSALSLVHIFSAAAVGCGVAFAVAKLAFGHLNMASGFLGSIIAGNGINIPMIYLARYRELRQAGQPLQPALEQTALDCRRGTWLGAVAAAGAYVSLGVTSFRGFSEFGLIGGVGSLACWLAAFALCPASIAALDRFRKPAPLPRPEGASSAGAAVSGGGSVTRVLGALATRRPLVLLLSIGVAAACLAPAIARYVANPWEYDFGKLRSASSSKRGAGHFSVKADEIFGTRGSPDLLLSRSFEEAAGVADAVVARDRQLFGGKLVQRVTTAHDYLGGRPAIVQRKLEVLADIRQEIDRALPHLRARDREFAETFRPPERLRRLTADDLPQLLRERFTETNGRFGTAVFVEIDPKLSRSRGEQLLKIADLLEGVRDPSGQVVPNASRASVFAEMIRSMTRDAPRTIGVAFAVVVVVAALATGALLPVLAVLSSLLLAVWSTLGAASTFDVRLNFLNFVALPLTFGIGVEYAINFCDRVRALGDIKKSLQSVGGAIAACSLTTMLGYGTLLFGDNLALRSFGKYAVMGELSCLATALLVLPAGLTLLRRFANRKVSSDPN
ncbi:MAG TPA: MMPL family transporter [Polyangiaceae bacterium]|nr:MMPL family transporter [Polyangiaceae bacterium]